MVIGWGDIGIKELYMIKIFGIGEELCWLVDHIDLLFCGIMHLLELFDAALKLGRVG